MSAPATPQVVDVPIPTYSLSRLEASGLTLPTQQHLETGWEHGKVAAPQDWPGGAGRAVFGAPVALHTSAVTYIWVPDTAAPTTAVPSRPTAMVSGDLY